MDGAQPERPILQPALTAVMLVAADVVLEHTNDEDAVARYVEALLEEHAAAPDSRL